MRVLLVNDYGTSHGGAEHQVIALRSGLRARGHEAWLFTSRARPLPLVIEADRTTFGTQHPVWRRVTQALNPVAPRDLARAIRELRPDVVHVRMFLTQLSPLILPVLRDVPSVLHVGTHQLVCPLNTLVLPDGSTCRNLPGAACQREGCVSVVGRLRFGVQRGLWNAWSDVFDSVITVSQAVRDRLEANGIGVTDVIWNGVPDRGPRKRLASTPTLSFAGRLVAKKGVDVLLEAFRQARTVIPDARLLIAGDGPERRTMEAMATTLGIGDAVSFLGHVSQAEIETRLGEAWAHVLPGRWPEPFGNSAAEALMRGTAVITSNTGGTAELVVHERTGLLVPAGDAYALASALVRVLSDIAFAERLGSAARDFAARELSDAVMLDRIEALYCRITDGIPLRPIIQRDAPSSPDPGVRR